MSIRFPIELAAAAEFAERAVDVTPAVPTEQPMRSADAVFDFASGGEDIRLVVGPGFDLIAGPRARKGIPGQTYH